MIGWLEGGWLALVGLQNLKNFWRATLPGLKAREEGADSIENQ